MSQPQPATQFCIRCGASIPADAAFCHKCGGTQSADPAAPAAPAAGQNAAPLQSASYNPPTPKPRRLTSGAKAWCWVCMVANAASFGLNLAAGTMASWGEEAPYMVAIVGSVLAISGFALLLGGRREGYVMVCAAAAVSLATNAFGPNAAAIVFGIVNPLVTWFIIRSSWPRLNTPGPTLKSRKAALFLAAFPYTGMFGIDRFYLGYIWTGLFKFFTVGGMFVLYIIDIVKIKKGTMKDKYGRPLRSA